MIDLWIAEAKDIQAIVDFQLAMALETENISLDPETVYRGVSTVFTDSTKGFYLIAQDKGRTTGCLMITYEWSDWRARTVWYIQSLFVIPEYRRRGIFKQMYAWLLEKVDGDDSIGGIRLYVDLTNLNAQKVYESLGMDGNHYRFYENMK